MINHAKDYAMCPYCHNFRSLMDEVSIYKFIYALFRVVLR